MMKDLWNIFIPNWNLCLRKLDDLTPEEVLEWVDTNPGDRNLALGYATACNTLDYWDDETYVLYQTDPECQERKWRLDHWNTDYASIVQSDPEYLRAAEIDKSWESLRDELEGRILDISGERGKDRWQQINEFMERNRFYDGPYWCPEEKMSPSNLARQRELLQQGDEFRTLQGS